MDYEYASVNAESAGLSPQSNGVLRLLSYIRQAFSLLQPKPTVQDMMRKDHHV